MNPKTYDTLTQAVQDLQKRGYQYDFNIVGSHLFCPELSIQLHPDQFQVSEVYRFEGESNPDDESVLFAIEAENGVKGLLVSAYGPYSEPLGDELMRKLQMPQA